ncbi:MAG: hypothetical protein LBV54_05115 [Puniceicoccales bacterium]|nr:hypothetical protein [Puniceicoccales bacterium]
MSQPEENNNSSGDWENQSELYWNEQEWNAYLQQNAAEQARFLSLYSNHRNLPDHLDVTAIQMGWETREWTPGDDSDDDDDDGDCTADSSDGQWPPYCVEQHPVYIATRALCSLLISELERSSAVMPSLMPTAAALALARGAHEIEHLIVMAVTAMDTADFALAVTLLKRASREVNNTMALLTSIEETVALTHFAGEFRFVLFDLREICLRGINDAKWELENPLDGD